MLLTGLLTSAFSWVTAGIAESAAGPGTVRSPSSSSALMRDQSQLHRSRIVIHIYARTRQATEAVVSEIEKVISEYLMDKVLDQPQDQQYIAKLTEQQVNALTF